MLISPATLFLVVFIPPLYFFTRGKIFAGLINGFFYLLSIPFLLIGGFFLWGCCAIHAAVYAQREASLLAQNRLIHGISAQVLEQQERLLQSKKGET